MKTTTKEKIEITIMKIVVVAVIATLCYIAHVM